MIGIVVFIALLILSAFFSGSETAFFSLGTVRLEKFKKRGRKALRIERLKENPDYLLSTILIGNMFVNIALSSLMTALFIKSRVEYSLFLSIIVSSLLILVFGEILPKGLALSIAEGFALFSSYALKPFLRIVYPVSFIIIVISRKIFKLFFRREIKEEDVLTEEELKEALEIGRSQGFIDEEEQDMIHSILDFGDVESSEIMTPRIDIQGVEMNSKSADVANLLKEIKHSYVPVFKKSVDNIEGVLKTKDYFLSKNKNLSEIMRLPFFVPETKNIADLLKELIRRNEKMAVVMDEYGGVSGIVTLEDIQEEIFGELYDEYEVPLVDIIQLSENEYRINSRLSVKDLNYELNLDIPEEEDTVGGFVLSCIERFPNPGEMISYKNIDFIVDKATKKRILSLKVKVHR